MKSKIGAFLLSFAIAFGLWLYVITVVSPESEDTFHDIPVVLNGESVLNERGLMILSGKNQTVDLKLEGYRTDLANLNKANIILLADLSQITTAGEHKLSYDISYSISQSGPLTVLEQTETLITVVVAEQVKKEIPVEVVYTGAVPENYIAYKQSAALDHTTVTISGPKDVISKIAKARVSVDLTDRTSTISEAYGFTLCDSWDVPVTDLSNVTTNLSEVRVMLRIQKTKLVPLVLDVIYGGGVTEHTSRIEMDLQSVQVAGSELALDSLTEIVLGTVDLSDILESTMLTYPIILPEGVINVTNVPEVNVSVSFPDLEIREYKVNNLVAKNLPIGLEAQWLTTSVTVRLRGETEVLKNLTAQDISVVVDFTNAEAGAQIYEAVVLVDTDAVVGTIGNYEVYVSVQIRSPLTPPFAYGTEG